MNPFPYETHDFKRLSGEDLDTFVRRSLRQAFDAGLEKHGRAISALIAQYFRVRKEALHGSSGWSPLWEEPLDPWTLSELEITSKDLEAFLRIGRRSPSIEWVTAGLELVEHADEMPFDYWGGPAALSYEPWRNLAPQVFKARCTVLIRRFPYRPPLKAYFEADDARRFGLYVTQRFPRKKPTWVRDLLVRFLTEKSEEARLDRFKLLEGLDSDIDDEIIRGLAIELLESDPEDTDLWSVLFEKSTSSQLAEAAALHLTTGPAPDGPPEQGILDGDAVDRCLRVVLQAAPATGEADWWPLVRVALAARGAATRHRAVELIDQWDRESWPSDIIPLVTRARKVEPDRATSELMGRLLAHSE